MAAKPTRDPRTIQDAAAPDIRRRGRWSTLRSEAETLAARFPPLLVEAEHVAATVAQGVHGRRRVGIGESFWEYRRYRDGDSPAQIDWRRSARTPHLFVRQNEWEAAESVWLWRDASASMGYRSGDKIPTKLERATVLTLAAASLLIRGGERIARLSDGHPPANGRVALRRIAYAFGEDQAEGTEMPRREPLPKFSQIVLMSDFLVTNAELEGWLALLDYYGTRQVRGHILQVLDPAEEEFPFAGRVRFQDPEIDLDLLIGRSEQMADAYRTRLAAVRSALIEKARRIGWTVSTHRTDRPPQTALLSLFAALNGQVLPRETPASGGGAT